MASVRTARTPAALHSFGTEHRTWGAWCAYVLRQPGPGGISSRGYDTVQNWVLLYVSNGNRFTCALDPDGAPVCWGIDDYGQATPPADERFTALSSGERHVCALRADGTPVCWGDPAQAAPRLLKARHLSPSVAAGRTPAPFEPTARRCAGVVTITVRPYLQVASNS